MTIEWLKLFHHLPEDRKLLSFSINQKWAWVCLLCTASQSSDRGTVLDDQDDMAVYCGFPNVQDYQFFLDKLRQKGMIEPTNNGFKIANWEKRQYVKPSDKPDATKERKRKQRANAKDSSKTMSRDVTPLSRSSHATDTDTDQDQDQDKDQDQDRANTESLISKTPEPTYPHPEQSQNIPTCLLVVNPSSVGVEKDFAVCSMNTDKKAHKPEPWGNGYDRRQSNRDRAQAVNWLSTGVANKRWKDRQDFDKFVSYVEIYAENRRQDPELNPDGTMYGEKYRAAVLNHTATTQDENDPMLTCWKIWNLEPAAPNYIETKPEVVAVVDDAAKAAFEVDHAKFLADNLARKAAAAAEKARKDEILRGLYES